MSKINSRDWKAWINTQPGADKKLFVTGEVETSSLNMVPVLKPAVPQGINATILLLDVTSERQGNAGGAQIGFREARYEREAQKGEYTEVAIFFEDDVIASVPVEDVS